MRMGRTTDRGRNPNLAQHVHQMVGARVEKYNSKSHRQDNRIQRRDSGDSMILDPFTCWKSRTPEALRIQRTQSEIIEVQVKNTGCPTHLAWRAPDNNVYVYHLREQALQ